MTQAAARRAEFEAALVSAHLPTLAVVTAPAAGEDSLLEGEFPVYDFFGDGMGGFSEGFQAASAPRRIGCCGRS